MKEIVSLWVDDWKRIYRAHPRITVAGTVVGLLLAFGIGFYLPYRDIKNQESLERKRAENLSYNHQLEALNNVQGSLNNLIAFVELQKTIRWRTAQSDARMQSRSFLNTIYSEEVCEALLIPIVIITERHSLIQWR